MTKDLLNSNIATVFYWLCAIFKNVIVFRILKNINKCMHFFQNIKNMPERKLPNLSCILQENIKNKIINIIEGWIERLLEMQHMENCIVIERLQGICQESKDLSQYLSDLLPSILFQILPNTIHKTFELLEELITKSTFHSDKRDLFYQFCRCVLGSISFKCFEDYDLQKYTNNTIMELAFEILPMVCNITWLRISSYYEWKLESLDRMAGLTNLKVFTYRCMCTNEIVAQLSLCCTLLKVLDIKSSKKVDEDSVENIILLKYLKFVDVSETTISSHGYKQILKELANIKNIAWNGPIETVTTSVSYEKAMNITKVKVIIRESASLHEKFLNITDLSLKTCNERVDLANLSLLTNLKNIKLHGYEFIRDNLRGFFEVAGGNLIQLKMKGIKYLDLITVLCHCRNLKSLALILNDMTMDNEISMDLCLPHFNSLETFEFTINPAENDVFNFIYLYDNLKTFRSSRNFKTSDNFVRNIVHSDGFRNLRVFYAKFCPLSRETANLLIDTCENLSILGDLRHWFGMRIPDFEDLKRRIRLENLDVTLIMNGTRWSILNHLIIV